MFCFVDISRAVGDRLSGGYKGEYQLCGGQEEMESGTEISVGKGDV